MSVSASDVGYKAYSDPSFAQYAGYSGSEVTESGFQAIVEIAYSANNMIVPRGTYIENQDKLKPDKLESATEFIHTSIKLTKMAVMQNNNFDRVLVVSYRI